MRSVCTIEDCATGHYARGWCRKHYLRWKRLGSPLDAAMTWAPVNAPCGYCAGPVTAGGKYRRWCSYTCSRAAERPRARECAQCGESFSLLTVHPRSGRRVKSDKATCDRCRKPNHLRAFIPAIVARDGNACGICQETVDLTIRYPDPASPSVDHVIPRSKGGADDLTNYQLACLGCNVRKRDRIDFECLTAATAVGASPTNHPMKGTDP